MNITFREQQVVAVRNWADIVHILQLQFWGLPRHSVRIR